jgi:hypothetical protein
MEEHRTVKEFQLIDGIQMGMFSKFSDDLVKKHEIFKRTLLDRKTKKPVKMGATLTPF